VPEALFSGKYLLMCLGGNQDASGKMEGQNYALFSPVSAPSLSH